MTLEQGVIDELIDMEAHLSRELKTMLPQEEILWNQKTRRDWALLGDRNLAFSYKKTRVRNYRNRVEMLKLDGVTWCCDGTKLSKSMVDYFVDLFTKDPQPNYYLKDNFFRLTPNKITNLDKAVRK